jgi:hypothetical protein
MFKTKAYNLNIYEHQRILHCIREKILKYQDLNITWLSAWEAILLHSPNLNILPN